MFDCPIDFRIVGNYYLLSISYQRLREMVKSVIEWISIFGTKSSFLFSVLFLFFFLESCAFLLISSFLFIHLSIIHLFLLLLFF